MSAESGIKTFRDSDGLWENYPVEQVASHDGWLADPTLVTEFYNARRNELVKTGPNDGHRLVAALEKDYDVTVVTQNVDNLHEQAGSSRVIHLHGELMKVCSSRDTEDPRYWQTLTAADCRVEPGTKAGDGSLLRPYIVRLCPISASLRTMPPRPTYSSSSARRSMSIPPPDCSTTSAPVSLSI